MPLGYAVRKAQARWDSPVRRLHRPSVSGPGGPGAAGLSWPAGWRAAEPGAGAASEVTHSPTWPKLFGAQRGDFLKTSVLQQLLRLERAAALVSPCTGLSAYGFSLSTAVLDRPPAHPFTSLKGPRPLLQHLKRVLGKSAVTGVTGRTGVTTAPFYLKPLQLPSF